MKVTSSGSCTVVVARDRQTDTEEIEETGKETASKQRDGIQEENGGGRTCGLTVRTTNKLIKVAVPSE